MSTLNVIDPKMTEGCKVFLVLYESSQSELLSKICLSEHVCQVVLGAHQDYVLDKPLINPLLWMVRWPRSKSIALDVCQFNISRIWVCSLLRPGTDDIGGLT